MLHYLGLCCQTLKKVVLTVPLAPGPAVILRQSERWWGWSQSVSRLPSCPFQLHTGPEVGGSSLRDNHASISTPLRLLHGLHISLQLLIFLFIAVSEWEHAAARPISSPSLRGVPELIQAAAGSQGEGQHRPSVSACLHRSRAQQPLPTLSLLRALQHVGLSLLV